MSRNNILQLESRDLEVWNSRMENAKFQKQMKIMKNVTHEIFCLSEPWNLQVWNV